MSKKQLVNIGMAILVCLIATLPVFAEDAITVAVESVANEAEPGGKAQYRIHVTNLQEERDIFRLAYDDFAIYPFSDVTRNIIVTPSQLKLETFETGVFEVVFNILDTTKTDISYETTLDVLSLTVPATTAEAVVKTYVISKKELVEITPELPEEIIPGEEYKIRIKLKNRANKELKNIEVLLASEIPQLQKAMIVDFLPNEKISETIRVTTNKDLDPGEYVVNVKVYKDQELRGSHESTVMVTEKKDVKEDIEETKSFMKKTTTITKTNRGNTVAQETIEVKAWFLKRVFSSAQPKPEVKDGKYVWEKSLEQNEEFTVTVTNNYRPILYGLLIIIIATILMNLLVQKSIIIRKRIFRIRRTEEGLSEFKILIHVKNGKATGLDGVKIMDIVPSFMDTTGEFKTLAPTKVQHGTKGKRLVWDIEKLGPGEERIIAYKVSSKDTLGGETRLPPAMLQFSKNGRSHTIRSAALFVEHTTTQGNH